MVPVKIGNILLATDFSAASKAAFPHAIAIAQGYGATVYVVHVTTPDMYGYAPPESAPALFEQVRRSARQKMADFTANLDFKGVPYRILFGEGEVWDTIEPMLAEYSIDLIVLGTRGRRGVKKLIMGSVAEEIIRLATRPVLSAGPHCAGPSGGGLRKILYPTDFSASAQKARDYALSLAKQFGSTLVALHVAQGPSSALDRRQREDEILIGRLREFLGADSTEVSLHIHYGNPAEEILRAASEYASDLIVMGVRGGGSMPRLSTAIGSTAHHVVSQAECAVITVRE